MRIFHDLFVTSNSAQNGARLPSIFPGPDAARKDRFNANGFDVHGFLCYIYAVCGGTIPASQQRTFERNE